MDETKQDKVARGVYSRLQAFNTNVSADSLRATELAQDAYAAIEYYSSVNQWEKAEAVHQELLVSANRFSDNVTIAGRTSAAAFKLFSHYFSVDQWQKAEQKYLQIRVFITLLRNDLGFARQLAAVGRSYAESIFRENYEDHQLLETIYTDIQAVAQIFPDDIIIANYLAVVIRVSKIPTLLNDIPEAKEKLQALENLARRFPRDENINLILVIKYRPWRSYYQSQNNEKQVRIISEAVEAISNRWPNGLSYTPHKDAIDEQSGLQELSLDYAKRELIRRLIDTISNQYGVVLEVLKTDALFFSDETHLKTIREKKYFISAESPDVTCKITEYLIQQAAIRYSLMHANRVEKANVTRHDLGAKIEEVRQEYQVAHEGKNPSLHKIASILNERNISSPNGKSNWHAKTVKRIISGPDSTPDR